MLSSQTRHRKVCQFYYILPPTNKVLVGYTVFSMPLIPSANEVCLHNFKTLFPILIKFMPHLRVQARDLKYGEVFHRFSDFREKF